MFHGLADAIESGTLSPEQRDFLINVFKPLAASATKAKRLAATRKHLLLERGRGRPPTPEDTRRSMASDVFALVGKARGAKLMNACHQIALEYGVGRPGNDAPDLRSVLAAYKDYLPMMLELQELSRQTDESSDS
jgi:hypothetical protein